MKNNYVECPYCGEDNNISHLTEILIVDEFCEKKCECCEKNFELFI